MIRKIRDYLNRRSLASAGILLLMLLLYVQPVFAKSRYHEAPKGSEWVMADWMFLSFAVFAGVAFLAFLFALKAGWLSNLDDAKYYVLEIEEKDFYTPWWADEGDET